MDLERAYFDLLARFPKSRLGYGREPTFPGSAAQPMTYALVAMAELRRTSEGSEGTSDRAERALRWLVRNHDLDRDDASGWGLPHAWDAFGDGVGAAGALNPPNHPYTITTALVIEALAQGWVAMWPETDSARGRLASLATRVATRWIRDAFTTTASGGYFWYSPHVSDSKFCPNVSAMMLGALRRGASVGLVEDPRGEVVRTLDEAAQGIVAARRDTPGLLAWDYIDGSEGPRLNDAVHHAYTLWGMESYRGSGGMVPIPWTPQDAANSLEGFHRRGRLLENIPAQAAKRPQRPMRLWGAGMCLAVLARHASLPVLRRWYDRVIRLYMAGAGPTLYPGAPAGVTYPRYAAHLLLGLAETMHRIGASTIASDSASARS